MGYEAGYLSLYRSGELQRRVSALEARLADCDLCPHACHVNRLKGEMVHPERSRRGFCRSGALPIVASVCKHMGEEPPITGSRGSGTVFFGNCNLRCVYCQNHQISQNPRGMRGKEVDCAALARQLLHLQDDLGCHNINFVSPSHFVPQLVRAVLEVVPLGLRIPLIYNTSGYDSVETLKLLEGVIDIYLPDIRYASDAAAKRYSRASNYVAHARAAIKEMHRQVGELVMDEQGVAQRGLIVRHLILPGGLVGSRDSLRWLAENVSPGVYLSVMAQYYPTHRAARYPELARRITPAEYDEVMGWLGEFGLENGWIQDLDAPESYQPDFERDGHPFSPPQPATPSSRQQ